jgi:uncharacterized MnhB-related membrane protein
MLAILQSWSMAWWATALIAFFAMILTEITWVFCVRWTAHTKPLRAACGASVMVLVAWLGLMVLLGDPWVAIPAEMVGAFVGTIIAIKLDSGVLTITRGGK